MVANTLRPAVALQACYVYNFLSKKYKFKIRKDIVLFNLILNSETKISNVKSFLEPKDICCNLKVERITDNEERIALTANAIALMEWLLYNTALN